MSTYRSCFRRTQRSRIRNKRPDTTSPRVLAKTAVRADQPSGRADRAAQRRQQQSVTAEEDAAESPPVAEMPDLPASAVRARTTVGSGQKQAARLQAAFEHNEGGQPTIDEQQRQQRLRPPLRQRRDRSSGPWRHLQHPAAMAKVGLAARTHKKSGLTRHAQNFSVQPSCKNLHMCLSFA